MHKLNVILGPTSTGKTALALEIAKKHRGVLISADSRQICKYMDIGTGKLPLGKNEGEFVKGDKKWTIDGIDIWGYDLADPNTYFSAYDYAQFAINKISELFDSADYETIILVGGTGFYIDAVTGRKNFGKSAPDFELRKTLEGESTDKLADLLTSLIHEDAKKIDLNNRVRIIRAIEIALNKEKNLNPLGALRNVDFNFVGLTADRPLLYRNADEWLEKIWSGGLLVETAALLENFGTSPKLRGLVYKSAVAFINNQLSETDAIQTAKFDLHAYIRRQQTYFKVNKDIQWFDIADKETPKKIENLLK